MGRVHRVKECKMQYTKREFGRLAVGALPAATLIEHRFEVVAQTRKRVLQ